MKRFLSCMLILALWLLASSVHAQPPASKDALTTYATGRLPITISKATTYITEPLRPDGYPDYLAVLNQRASQGVTPENNAVVLFMQAFGPDTIDRKNREKFFKMLGVAPPNDKGAYFVDYYKYVKEHTPDAMKDRFDAYGRWHIPLDSQEFMRALQRPWAKEECPLIAKWLAMNERALALLAEASKRPRFYFPLVARSDWLGFINLFPYRLPMRSAVRCLKCRAMLRLHEGRIEEAWDDLQTCHRLARIPGRASMSTVDCTEAMMCDGMACDGDQKLAHFVKLTPEQAETFCAKMEMLLPVPTLKEQLDGFERFLYLDSICATVRGSLKPSDIVPISSKPDDSIRGGDTPEWNAIRGSLKKWIGGGQVDWDETMRLGNEHFDRIVALAQLPTLSERHVVGSKLDEEQKWQKAIYGYPVSKLPEHSGNKHEGNDTPRSIFTRGVFVVYLAQLNDTAGVFVNSRTTITSQLTPIALALSAYRTEHGQYPDELRSLQPTYLARLPKDPWNSGDYRYHRHEDGYLLYSVGPNGNDNAGPRPDIFSGSADSTDDIGILMPDRSGWDNE
jgi:hypothetical protein